VSTKAAWWPNKKLSKQIAGIAPGSPAAHSKLAVGDVLLSINGNAIHDVLDYRFHAAERKLKLQLQRGEKIYTAKIRKDQYDDLGLDFANGLMDKQTPCKNRCIFCFIDQLPRGLRKPLYFKDDDARLGFLFGNYITLTNLTDHDVQRIIAMRLSPINVSVHTTNPALRCQMMGNPHAGDCLRYLHDFAAAGLELNCQLVLCPGINDGDELRRSLRDLLQLPTVKSIAAVPVGITKHRDGLHPLEPFTCQQAQQVIDIFEEFRTPSCELCAADEFFLLAEQLIPDLDYYGDMRQLENGVGMWALLRDDMLDLLQHLPPEPADPRPAILITGIAAAPLMQFFIDELQKVWHNISIEVQAITNDFLGEHITVAGLLTAQDVIAQLQRLSASTAKRGAPPQVVLPAAMFNHEGVTLDDYTAEDIARALDMPVHVVANDAQSLIDALID